MLLILKLCEPKKQGFNKKKNSALSVFKSKCPSKSQITNSSNHKHHLNSNLIFPINHFEGKMPVYNRVE